MSDPITERIRQLGDELVKSVEEGKPDVDKLRQMTEIAKSMGEDTAEVERFLDVADGVAEMVFRRFKRTPPKKEE